MPARAPNTLTSHKSPQISFQHHQCTYEDVLKQLKMKKSQALQRFKQIVQYTDEPLISELENSEFLYFDIGQKNTQETPDSASQNLPLVLDKIKDEIKTIENINAISQVATQAIIRNPTLKSYTPWIIKTLTLPSLPELDHIQNDLDERNIAEKLDIEEEFKGYTSSRPTTNP